MKKILLLFIFIPSITSAALACNQAYVKYRDTPVCLEQFTYQDTSKSSFVRGAWYDISNNYMLLSLSGTKYHYCRVPENVWNSFKQAVSYGKFYNAYIKGRYDCRLGGVPAY